MALSLRSVLGPALDAMTRSVPPPPAAIPGRADVQVSVVGKDADKWTVDLAIPAYDLSTNNLLAELRVYMVAAGHGLPTSADGYIESSYAFASVDLSAVLGGANVTVPLPEVDAGDYVGQIVLRFDDTATPPPAPPVPPSDTPAPAVAPG